MLYQELVQTDPQISCQIHMADETGLLELELGLCGEMSIL